MFEKLDMDYGLKDQGLLNTYLGVQVEQNEDSIKIHQTKYCEEVIERFNFTDAHPSRIPMETNMRLTVKDTDTDQRKQVAANGKTFPYRELVGSLMYLTTCTRPDIAFVVGQLSRYVQNPTQQHIGAAKRVLWYLIGTKTLGIVYSKEKTGKQKPELIVNGYCDSDWGNDPDTRKSITGFVHCMAGGVISWASRRQSIVAQSTAEAEYVAACEACMDGQGLRNVLIEVFPELETKLRMGIDNQAAFVMATNPTYSRRTRHIELRWHFVRDQVAKRTVDLWKVRTEVNPSDIMTKPLASDRLETLCAMVGLSKKHLPQ
ncbi:mitochondrial protein [Phytophthora palmivora]|uniref:Mitochondrial protein n=1 Tax=Phytophthora palmivora TaxID=4796 RepID=A0A2P4YCF8_9STRA|nr:mitochondrial protein [Phytophthora palmivora]